MKIGQYSVEKRFLTPFLLAVLLHVVVFIFIFFSISFPSQPTSMSSASPEQTNIVKAVTINQSQVDQEMARLQQEKNAAIAAQQAREQRAAQQRLEIKRQTERAEKALAAVRAEQARLAQQKQQQAQQQKKLAQQQQQQQKLKQQQTAQKDLQQKLQAEQQEMAAANAKRVAGVVNKYNALILNAIYPNWIVSDKQKNLSTDLLINLASDGTVLSVTVAQGSGVASFDRSAIAAVYKSSPLPVPSDPQAFAEFRQFRLTLKPENIVSQ